MNDPQLDRITERTFLFTDIVGSTPLWERDPTLMASTMQVHDRLLVGAVAHHDGHLFAQTGDGIVAAFDHAASGFAAAVDAQRAFAAHDWPAECRIAIRSGLHVGPAVTRNDNYFGPTLNQAARVMDAGHGGQILASSAALDAAGGRLPNDVRVRHEGRHHLKGITAPVDLVTILIDGLRDEFPPLRSATGAGNRIPVMLNDLIGRERELAETAAAIDAHRLVTLLGPGGTGKTHLSVSVATAAAGRFAGGVHVVDLTPASSGDDLAGRVAETVLGPDAIARPGSALDRIVDQTRAPRLIVLDNCEHVLDDVADLVGELLERSAQVHILTTTREPLDLSGERVLPVEPLVVGDDGDFAPAEALFVSHARSTVARLGALDPALVSRICRRVDGLPLAIQLAASNLKFLSLGEIDARLFDLLATPNRRARRGAAGRHGTIDAAVEWSTQLLDEEERAVFDRCSVFAGSFDLDAAIAVCTDETVDADTIPGVLRSLIERSLVSTVFDESGNRFRLLQVVREFALRGLDDGGATADRHQEHFLRRAEDLTGRFDREATAASILTIELDDDNYLTALRHVSSDRGVRNARRLAMHLHTYWEETGRLHVGLDEARRLSDPPDRGSRLWLAVVGLAVSYGAMTGRLDEAPRLEATLVEFADATPDPGSIGIYFALGFAAISRADLREGEEMFRLAAASAHGVSSDAERQALMTAGSCAAYDDRPDDALEYYRGAEQVPPPRQGWFDDYATVFRTSATIQLRGRGGDHADDVHAMDRALGRLLDEDLQFRTSVAVCQAAAAFDLADAHDVLDRWWAATLASARRAGHLWSVCLSVELAAHSFVRSGDHDRAIEAWASIDHALGAAGYRLPPTFEMLRERYESLLDATGVPSVAVARAGVTARSLNSLVAELETRTRSA
ncbi:MAG: adenylate/guanylate cyclase domain-containing protein [Ilumatobacteraceae bacterium]|nr:adenylate/guanylate cyclase domain-containing protein [Ilumatobacteraceae bacterium]